MLILEFEEEKRRQKPTESEVSGKQKEEVFVMNDDFNGSETMCWHAILAISAHKVYLENMSGRLEKPFACRVLHLPPIFYK